MFFQSQTMNDRIMLRSLFCWVLSSMSVVAAPPTATEEPSKFSTANNDFALTMLRELDKDNQTANLFYSPFSIMSALMMTMEGARGETALQMGQSLQFVDAWRQDNPTRPWNLATPREQLREIVNGTPKPDAPELANLRKTLAKAKDDLKGANKKVESLNQKQDFQGAQKAARNAEEIAKRVKQLTIQAEPYELRVANAIWVEQSMPLKPEFLEVTKKFYGTNGASSSDFIKQSEQERKRINQWIATETKDKIRDLLSPGTINSDTRMVLANAIYFLGTWRSPFLEANTQPGDFFLASGQTKSTPLMFQAYESGVRYGAFQGNGAPFDTPKMIDFDADPKIGYPEDDGFEIVEIPYNGEGIAMSILLPRTRTGLSSLLSKTSSESLDKWHRKLSDREVLVTLPRFRMETKLELVETLKRLGMKVPFNCTSGGADFSGMTTRPEDALCITHVIHQAVVDVNEKGTEAAAATAVVMATSAAPIQRKFTPEFRADHPFLFMIRDTRNGLILFLGIFEQPSDK
jgi:serine protease inhibitor